MGFKQRSLARLAAGAVYATALLASGCSVFLAGEPPVSQITSQTDTLSLAWDPPAGAVTSYKVFYRAHGTTTWNLFAEIPAQPNPALALHQADFGNGSFDFGVEAVGDTGEESAMHTSLDTTAQPTSGWYLSWNL